MTPIQPSSISDRIDFSYVLSTNHLDTSYQVRVNWLSVQEKNRKIDFQDGRHGDHLGFPIRTILAIFDLQVTSILYTMFRVNWPFGSGEEAQNRY